ncbi:MAG: GldG family protein [Salinivirgaceae bacterium]|nr:GldG family protein [Salinivirgaceae bacterium]
MKNKDIKIYVAMVLAALVAVNIISDKFFFRIDLTGDNRYTLSRATKDILANLDETVTVTAYFSDDLPADVARAKHDFRDLLTEYRNASHGQFEFEFVNPSASDELENRAVSEGLYPVMINVRDKDQMTQQRAFLGAVIEKGGQKEVIPFVQPSMPVEYALSSAIRKMQAGQRPVVGFLQGHGEPSPQEMQQVLAEMSVIYDMKPVSIERSANVLDSITTLAIIAPTDSITAPTFAAIDRFMARGGRVLVCIERISASLDRLFADELNTGLEQWLATKNVRADSKMVIDNSCANVNVQQQQGMYRVNVQQKFPYIPFVVNFASHAITNGLEQVQLQFASPVVYTGDSTATFTTLLFSSDRSATLNVPTNIDVQRQWTMRDFPLAEIPLGGVLEGEIGGVPGSKLAVLGDADFILNGDPRQPHQQSADNISLFVNTVDYLSDDTGLVDLRTKGITSRPIDQLDDGMRSFVKWLNVLLPIVLVILIGIIRQQQQRNLRIKRMEEGYVD